MFLSIYHKKNSGLIEKEYFADVSLILPHIALINDVYNLYMLEIDCKWNVDQIYMLAGKG